MKSLKHPILAAMFAVLTAAGAFLRIPAPGAPVTLQLFFTLCAGLLLGAKWGALSQILYLLVGLLGLPVFAMGGGFSYVLQPSFGFLLGLVPAAYIAGLLQKKPVLACLGAWLALYAVGLPYLHFLTRPMPFLMTLKAGLLVFLPGDALKLLAACLLCPKVQKALRA